MPTENGSGARRRCGRRTSAGRTEATVSTSPPTRLRSTSRKPRAGATWRLRNAAEAPVPVPILGWVDRMPPTDTEQAPTSREERITAQRRGLPDSPGVYLFRGKRGRVLYVGKAKSVTKRVAGHFSNPSTRGPGGLLD